VEGATSCKETTRESLAAPAVATSGRNSVAAIVVIQGNFGPRCSFEQGKFETLGLSHCARAANLYCQRWVRLCRAHLHNLARLRLPLCPRRCDRKVLRRPHAFCANYFARRNCERLSRRSAPRRENPTTNTNSVPVSPARNFSLRQISNKHEWTQVRTT